MYFDKLARGVEELWPDLVHIVQKSKLFVISKEDTKAAIESADKNADDLYVSDFFLPFQHVAVEDYDGVTLLWQDEPDLIGLKHSIHWIDLVRVTEWDHVKCGIVYGGFRDLKLDDKKTPDGHSSVTGILSVHRSGCMNDDDVFRKVSTKTIDAYKLADNPRVCIEELMWINTPDRFILKTEPLKVREIKKNGSTKIHRSHERPHFTILKPHEIRQRLGLTTGTDGHEVTAHERRAHWRTLRSDRYTHKKGQRIHISSTWVGPSEKIIGNKKYKVLL